MNKRFALILIALALLLTTAAWSWDLRLSPAMRPIAPAPTKVVPQIDVVYTDTAPTIDGDIDLTGEWADAEVVHVTGTRDMDVYFLADENYLYLGYDLLDNSDLVNGDASVFLFDNNNDDAWPDDCPGTTEGIYAAGYFDGSMNEYYTTVYNDGGTPNACQPNNPTEYVQAAIGMSSKGNVQIEMRMDFTAGQLYGAPEETIGIALGEVNNDTNDYFWPAGVGPSNMDPGLFADMTYPSFTPMDDDTGPDDDDTGPDDDDTGPDDDDTGPDDDDTNPDDDTDDDDTDDDDTDDDDTDDDDDDNDDYIPPIDDDDDDDDDNGSGGDDNLSGSRGSDDSGGGCA
ncbi:MAG TPA: hypothetical protein PK961_03345 [bacterium]|nr:hypothetical protein [bacterium]